MFLNCMSGFKYSNFIPEPAQVGITGHNSFSENVKNTNVYSTLLNSGFDAKSDSAFKARPLGNAYLLNLNVKCKDSAGTEQPRSAYINNFPTGEGSLSGLGLIPSIIDDIEALDPSSIINALEAKGPPTCRQASLMVTDSAGTPSSGSGYILDSDLKAINPCWFTAQTNPITNQPCTWSSSWAKARESAAPGQLFVPAPTPVQESFVSGRSETDAIFLAGCGFLLLVIISKYMR